MLTVSVKNNAQRRRILNIVMVEPARPLTDRRMSKTAPQRIRRSVQARNPPGLQLASQQTVVCVSLADSADSSS
jgi:hypothetical protein